MQEVSSAVTCWLCLVAVGGKVQRVRGLFHENDAVDHVSTPPACSDGAPVPSPYCTGNTRSCTRDLAARARDAPDAPLVAKLSAANGMVPAAVPECLKSLTMVESQMIARGHPVVKTFRKGGGQRRFEGHVVSLAQDITALATELPWRPCTADIPIVVIQPPDGGTWEGRQFMVSVSRVETALTWLIANSPGYADVRMDIERLSHLRQDGREEVDVMDLFDTLTEEDGEGEQERPQEGEEGEGAAGTRDYQGVGAPPDPNCDDVLREEEVRGPLEAAGQGAGLHPGQIRETFIPADTSAELSEEQAVRQALERLAGARSGSSTVNYPATTGPYREDNTPRLASMCFPTLFPTGDGDPFVRDRVRHVSMINTLTHLMRFADMPAEGSNDAPHYRFASHRTFAYWALNIRMRSQAKEQTRVFLSRNSEQVEVPLGELGDREMQQLVGAATRWTANISGTDGYWLVRASELEEAVDQLESPSAFVTFSAADHHWHDLHRLFPAAGEEPAPGDEAAVRPLAERHRSLIANPHIADWWVWERMHVFNDVFFGDAAFGVRWWWMRAEWPLRSTLHVHGCWQTSKGPEGGLVALCRTFLKGFIGRRNRRPADGAADGAADESGAGDDGGDDGGVSDADYARVQDAIIQWLEDVGFTASNPAASAEGVVVDELARERGRSELARDIREPPERQPAPHQVRQVLPEEWQLQVRLPEGPPGGVSHPRSPSCEPPDGSPGRLAGHRDATERVGGQVVRRVRQPPLHLAAACVGGKRGRVTDRGSRHVLHLHGQVRGEGTVAESRSAAPPREACARVRGP